MIWVDKSDVNNTSAKISIHLFLNQIKIDVVHLIVQFLGILNHVNSTR